ncbi:unnamed protein product [[Candida] boidinii]|nr:unnamed protein product [[Candida] boidinii]
MIRQATAAQDIPNIVAPNLDSKPASLKAFLANTATAVSQATPAAQNNKPKQTKKVITCFIGAQQDWKIAQINETPENTKAIKIIGKAKRDK